jgi:AbiU2
MNQANSHGGKRRRTHLKIATMIPVSALVKRGLGQMQDPRQVEIERQIKHYRERFFFLEARYHGLLAAFHMLKPLLKNERLRKRLDSEAKQRSASVVATVLFEACVIDCHTLINDTEEHAPSFCTMLRPFRERSVNQDLLDDLARRYSHRNPYWPDASKVSPWTAEEIEAHKRRTERSNLGRRLAFWRTVRRLRNDWSLMVKAGELIRPFRGTVVAHWMLELDSATDSYRLPSLPKWNELYETIERILPIMSRSITNLASVLVGGGDRLDCAGKTAKNDAAIFWDLPHPDNSL